jgi:L-ascorbate metabolism protein UlaG (beta-lactamase superfamily)
MKAIYYGHSCFEFHVNGKKLLFDPFITPNPMAGVIQTDQLKPDIILISHGHQDHIADALDIAGRSNALVISNYEIIAWLSARGITNVHAMNTGGSRMFDFGKVKCVNALHSSSLPDGSYGGSAMGFLIESTSGNFYYAGDTALTFDMKLIGDYKNIDFSLLPIGGNFTMDVDNAIIASEFVKCPRVVGMHYNTFDSIAIDTMTAIDKFRSSGKELILPMIGETFELKIQQRN